MRSTRQQARRAGWLYLLVVLIAPIGLIYVPGKVMVRGDAGATLENLRASEGLVRLGIASELVHQVIFVFVVLALYRLFRPVDEWLSLQMLVLGALLSVPIAFVNVLNEVAALVLVSGADFLAAFPAAELDARSPTSSCGSTAGGSAWRRSSGAFGSSRSACWPCARASSRECSECC